MKTVLFVVGPALGHVGRSLVIARALLKSSPAARIVFAHVSPGHGDRLLEPEFDTIPIRRQLRGTRFADGLELAIRAADPALICLDLSPVPWLYLVRFPEIPRAYVANFFLTGLIDAETFQDRHLHNGSVLWNRRRSRRGLPELQDAKTLYDADAVLLCDPIKLVPPDAIIADPYHVVGPCVWQADGSCPDRLRDARRLLLVSLGSTGRPVPVGIVEKLRQTLGCEASVSVTGGRLAEESGTHHMAYSEVPLRPILERSALAITQGGAGSTYAALLEGVPVAVWPAHRNHEILGEVLTRAGVGAFVTELAELGPGEIRRKVADMEDASSALRAASRGEFGPERAAEILRSMV